MLIVSIPKSTEVGDVVTVKINGNQFNLELGYEEIELVPAEDQSKSQRRKLIRVLLREDFVKPTYEEDDFMTLICE
jgi:hypothetical protein